MPTIPSPYNFAPLADQVFHPDWRTQISHDMPFSDGVSGCPERVASVSG